MASNLIKIFFTIYLFFLVGPHSAMAGTCVCYDESGNVTYNGDAASKAACNSGCGDYYSYSSSTSSDSTTSTSGSTVSLTNPLGDLKDPQTLIGKVIGAALGLVGSLALAMFIYGGFIWMTAQGNSEKVKKGRDTMVWATLGLIIIFSAYNIIAFVFNNVINSK
ncbi:MAG: pilin [Patescibacteria group bacterium]|jgi:hypothetical protein